MHTHNILYRGLIIVVLATLLLLAVSLPGTAAPATQPAADPNAGWQEVGAGSASGGGISDNSGHSWVPSLAIAPGGTPYVVWGDYSNGDSEIYMRRWNGSSWEEVGAGFASGGGISDNSGNSWDPSQAIAPDGTPYIAWHDNSGGDQEIYVRRWNGSSWEEVGAGSASGGGISDNSGWSGCPSLAIAPDGTPYVAWGDDSGGGDDEIYVRRWNGSSWEEVGAGSASGGGISDNSGNSWVPSLAIGPDGTPYVAWGDDSSGDDEIYVRRWNGSSWEEVGAGSASGGGISGNSGNSWVPSLAIGPDGTPYIAWGDDSSGDDEIYVRRWNGSSWEEVGTGSASGGGISDNSGNSWVPSLAIGPDGTPYVAWGDDSSGDDEIYVRTSTPPPAPTSSAIYLPIVMKGYCGCGPDNYEPNDTFAQAYGPLASGPTYPSYISCCDVASQRDYFYIDISTTNPIEVDLTNIPAGIDYDLYLYNSAQAEVGRSQNDGNAPEHISHTPAGAGRYYILVFSPYAHYSDSPYSLRVTYD